MKILSLQAENIQRLSVVEIDAQGKPVIVLAGENEAGKSSVLDAIAMALGGKDLCPAQPIRKGHARAQVKLDIGDYKITRAFTPTGSQLSVTTRDGVKCPSPQALLDGLVGNLTFNPLAFVDMDDDDQAATLRRIAKIDVSDLEEAHKKAFDERTLINRDAKQIEGALAKTPTIDGVGTEPESTEALLKELAAIDVAAGVASEKKRDADRAADAHASAKQKVLDGTKAVKLAEDALKAARSTLTLAESATDEAAGRASLAARAADEAAAAVPDRAPVVERLSRAEETNAKVRENQARQKLVGDLAAKKRESESLTTQINRLESQKADRLNAAQFPIEGLGLDDLGAVTWNGLPFAQASTAVRVRASVAIGLALNPALKILLIRNGNDLGAKNLHLIADLAAGANAQVWIEKIENSHGLPTVVIEDGSVKSSELVEAR